MSVMVFSHGQENTSSSNGVSTDAFSISKTYQEIRHSIADTAKSVINIALLGSALNEAKEDDWDGYGAIAANSMSFYFAKEFLLQLPSSIPSPDISVDPDGEFTFEWYLSANRFINLSMSDNGEMNYLVVLNQERHKGLVHFESNVPDAIMAYFGRVFSKI